LAIAVSLLVIGSAGLGIYLKTTRTTQIDSIAVLPLENRSNDADAEYISDGITESISNSLARLPGLKVIPHSVAFHYKSKALDVQKVGDALGVQAVLTGRVAQRGDDRTIGVELDDVRFSFSIVGRGWACACGRTERSAAGERDGHVLCCEGYLTVVRNLLQRRPRLGTFQRLVGA